MLVTHCVLHDADNQVKRNIAVICRPTKVLELWFLHKLVESCLNWNLCTIDGAIYQVPKHWSLGSIYPAAACCITCTKCSKKCNLKCCLWYIFVTLLYDLTVILPWQYFTANQQTTDPIVYDEHPEDLTARYLCAFTSLSLVVIHFFCTTNLCEINTCR